MLINTAFMTFSTPELELAEVLSVAASFGYDGIEPRLDAGQAHGVEVTADAARRRQIRDMVRESGIKLACLATSLKFADPDQQAAMLDQARERIDLAGDLEVPCLRLFGGKIPAGLSREAAITGVAGCLRELAGLAAQRQVTLCFETHDDWCDPEHVAAVIRAVDHPAVAVNWDIMHPVRTGKASMRQAFDSLRPWIRHLHVHDGVTEGGKLRLVPIGEGAIDHREALVCLSETGYRGFISGEWIGWEPWETHLPRELAALKRIAEGIDV